jgi:hypothetical protein
MITSRITKPSERRDTNDRECSHREILVFLPHHGKQHKDDEDAPATHTTDNGMQQQGGDDDAQGELATQAHPENPAPEDEGIPEAEVIDDTDLGNTEEEEEAASASAMDVQPEILNEKEELGHQDEAVVEVNTFEQIRSSTIDPEEKKAPPTDTSTDEQHEAAVLPSSITKEPRIAAKKATTSTKIKGWLKAKSHQLFYRSQLHATSPEETGPAGTIDRGTMTKCAAAAAASAADTAAATTAVTTATASAVSTNTGPTSLKLREPRHEMFTSSASTPVVVATATARSTRLVTSAEKPERRYKKILSAKSVLGGPSPKAAASRKLSLQASSPSSPRKDSASKRKLSLQSSPPTVAEVVASPTTKSLTTKVRAAGAERSAEKNKKQKTSNGSKSSAKPKGPATTSKSKKHANPHETYSGPPDEPIEGGWPAGWTKSVVKRQSGATAGTQDSYWYTPTLEYKLRSMKEVKRFMAALATAKGDEKEAWGVFKHKK